MVRPESVHVNATHASTGATCTALFPCKGFCVRSVCIPRFAKRRCVGRTEKTAGNRWQSTERQAVRVLNVRCALSPAPSAPWSWPWCCPERAFFEIGWRHQGASQSHLKRTPEAASTWTTLTGNRGTRARSGLRRSRRSTWQPNPRMNMNLRKTPEEGVALNVCSIHCRLCHT